MGAKLIAYECGAAEHQPTLSHPDKLTIFQGAWAFCPFDARASGHEWRETGGEGVEDLMTRCGLHGGIAVHEARAVAHTGR